MTSSPKELPLRVNEDDLIERHWSCKNYPGLHSTPSKCDVIVPTSIKYRVHVRQYHLNPKFPKVFQCPVKDCKDYEKLFSRVQYLQNHYDSIHRETKDYTCQVCTKEFSCKKTFVRHEKDCKSPFLECRFCDLSYSSHSSLSRHVRKSHLNELRKQTDTTDSVTGEEDLAKENGALKYLLIPVEKYTKLLANTDQNPPAHSSHSHSQTSQYLNTSQTPASDYPTSPATDYPSSPKRQKVSEATTTWITTPLTDPPPVKIMNSVSSSCSQSSAARELEWKCGEGWSREPVLRKPCVGFDAAYEESGVLNDKPLFSAIDNITTQTDNFWSINELSTQTCTEQQSFGTQTQHTDDHLVSSFLDCDFVEYLDGAVQTEHEQPKTDSACFAAQTSISTESFSNDRSCGVDRFDRDCQTYYYKSSQHTQTNMIRERPLIVADGLNTQTQTTQEQFPQSYHESFTQTIDDI